MRTTLALITLITSTFVQAAYAQVREPDIRVIGASSSAGGAQDSIGSGVGKRAKPAFLYADATMPKDDLVRTFMVDYARCIYELDRRSVDKMLDQIPGTDGYTKAAQRAVVNQCLATGDMRFQQSSLQGAAYIYKYKTEFGTRAPVLKPDPVDYAALARGAAPEWAGRYIAYRKLAQCVVRADPVASRALVLGPIGSASEAGAIQTLGPSLGTCLDKGATVNLTKERLTGIVAEALYRLSVAGTAK